MASEGNRRAIRADAKARKDPLAGEGLRRPAGGEKFVLLRFISHQNYRMKFEVSGLIWLICATSHMHEVLLPSEKASSFYQSKVNTYTSLQPTALTTWSKGNLLQLLPRLAYLQSLRRSSLFFIRSTPHATRYTLHQWHARRLTATETEEKPPKYMKGVKTSQLASENRNNKQQTSRQHLSMQSADSKETKRRNITTRPTRNHLSFQQPRSFSEK